MDFWWFKTTCLAQFGYWRIIENRSPLMYMYKNKSTHVHVGVALNNIYIIYKTSLWNMENIFVKILYLCFILYDYMYVLHFGKPATENILATRVCHSTIKHNILYNVTPCKMWQKHYVRPIVNYGSNINSCSYRL